MHFFSATCEFPVLSQPDFKPPSCSRNCVPFEISDTVINGSCVSTGFAHYMVCSESTKVRMTIYKDWDDACVGSPYLTCTSNGWFPFVPRRDNFRVGK